MKKIVFILLIFLVNYSFSQDYLDKIAKQAVEIDSLKRELKSVKDQANKGFENLEETINRLNRIIKVFQVDSAEVHKFKSVKMTLEKQLMQYADSLHQLRFVLSTKEQEIIICNQRVEKEALESYNKGQEVVFSHFSEIYNSAKSFDDLIRSFTELSLERDLALFVNNKTAEQKLRDMQRYFAAKKILEESYNAQTLAMIYNRLDSLQQTSDLLDNLKTNLDDYKQCYDALEKTIVKIIEIDSSEIANNDEIRKFKLDRIISELSSYIFNYNINMSDFPYLSDIILEIIKRKQTNANADISDLLKKF